MNKIKVRDKLANAKVQASKWANEGVNRSDPFAFNRAVSRIMNDILEPDELYINNFPASI